MGRPSPAEACCGKARTASSYNRCGAGKWAAAGRESEAAVGLLDPLSVGTGTKLARSAAARGRFRLSSGSPCRRRRYLYSQAGQFAVDPAVAPFRVLLG